MRVDLNRLRGVPNLRLMNSIITDIIREANDKNDRIYLSDLLIASQSGEGAAEPLMMRLREDPNRVYKLFCIRDEYGAKVNPGDKVKRWYKKTLKRDGVPIPTRELNSTVRSGRWESDMMSFEEFEVDSKGCITVNATDAEHFLSHFGVHGYSDQRISFHPDVSGEPHKDPKTGQTRIVWYWRFYEADKDTYESLPDLTRVDSGKQK